MAVKIVFLKGSVMIFELGANFLLAPTPMSEPADMVHFTKDF